MDLLRKSDLNRRPSNEFSSIASAAVKCVCPVAQSAAVELVVSDDCSLFVHSHRTILPGKSVGCVVVGWETGAEYTESRVYCGDGAACARPSYSGAGKATDVHVTPSIQVQRPRQSNPSPTRSSRRAAVHRVHRKERDTKKAKNFFRATVYHLTCTILFWFWQNENVSVLTGENSIAKANKTFSFRFAQKQNKTQNRADQFIINSAHTKGVHVRNGAREALLVNGQ